MKTRANIALQLLIYFESPTYNNTNADGHDTFPIRTAKIIDTHTGNYTLHG